MAPGLIRPYQSSDYSRVVDIFWETSARREFSSTLEKEKFQQQYLDDYLTQIALVYETQTVAGYVVATLDTLGMREKWPLHLNLFEDLYARYPAHLHINLASGLRGQGVGSQLLAALEKVLGEHKCTGVHLITSGAARNVSFYLQNDYSHKVERLWNDHPLLLLGKTL